MITFTATGRNARACCSEPITTGSVGIEVVFDLDEAFDGLTPTAVICGGGEARDMAIVDGRCTVPHECLRHAGVWLRIGVYARNADGTIVIPTVWAGVGKIYPGTRLASIDPAAPTPDWAAHVQETADAAAADAATARCLTFAANTAETARAAEGTQILNKFNVTRTAAQVGWFHDASNSRLSIYSLLGCLEGFGADPVCMHAKYFYMFEKDSAGEPYEFTLDNAPNVREFSNSADDSVFKSRTNVGYTALPLTVDFRICAVSYDGAMNIMHVNYSDQYRYVVAANGSVTRTVVETEPGDSEDIVAIGAMRQNLSVGAMVVYSRAWPSARGELQSLVNTAEPAAYRLIIPDDWFADAPNGWTLYAISGDGVVHLGPTVRKAPDGLTLGTGTANEVTLTAAQLRALLALI